jgi:hypothetical protein
LDGADERVGPAGDSDALVVRLWTLDAAEDAERISDRVPGALLDIEGRADCVLMSERVPYDAETQFVDDHLPVAVTFPDLVVDNVARDEEVAVSDFAAVRDPRAEVDTVLLILTVALAVLVADDDRVAFPDADDL